MSRRECRNRGLEQGREREVHHNPFYGVDMRTFNFLLVLLWLVKVECCCVTVQRIYRIRVGEQLGKEGVEDVPQICKVAQINVQGIGYVTCMTKWFIRMYFRLHTLRSYL